MVVKEVMVDKEAILGRTLEVQNIQKLDYVVILVSYLYILKRVMVVMVAAALAVAAVLGGIY